ncbi:hypothetical protein BRADI_1g49854v3 [Brachypodium distachyon]|uniref:Uncharacterized protein n=1 Tax=Brachypodium distachyon TaxID=15368 RepID=A0A2K2DQN1_BRADI|nr:hypothetical protein BRADI_1g49854v3 [Brachypodium distachyon]
MGLLGRLPRLHCQCYILDITCKSVYNVRSKLQQIVSHLILVGFHSRCMFQKESYASSLSCDFLFVFLSSVLGRSAESSAPSARDEGWSDLPHALDCAAATKNSRSLLSLHLSSSVCRG